ncbi:MAG: dockerin type I domain-containing protein [Bacteroidota bacterium]
MLEQSRTTSCSSLPDYVVPPDWQLYQCPEDLNEEHLVPIQIHATIDANGNPSITDEEVESALVKLNISFKGGNFTFYTPGPISIADDSSLDVLDTQAKYNKFRELSPPFAKAINYYLPSTYGFAPSASSPFSPLLDHTDVSMSAATFIISSSTREHETGHALGLFHTFKSTTTAGQSHVSCGGLPNGANVDRFELVIREEDHSLPYPYPNCAYACASESPYQIALDAGDLVCDTPADPFRGFNQTACLVDATGCVYIGQIPGPNNTTVPLTDLNGQAYTPDVSNYMSYYNCRSSFTEGQFERMLYFFLNSNAFPSPDCTTTTIVNTEEVIHMPSGNPVKNVAVKITNFTDPNCQGGTDICAPSQPTDAAGVFRCVLTNQGHNQAELSKADDWLNGVTTNDLILIQRHILGIERLDGWNQIAADVNGSGTITTFDLTEIRKLILAIESAFPIENITGGPWLFFPEQIPSIHPDHFDTALPLTPFNMPSPYGYPNFLLNNFCYSAAPLANGEGGFHAIKMGDVNGSANTQNLLGNSSDRSQAIIDLTNPHPIQRGETFTLQLSAERFQNIAAFGLGLYLDTERVQLEGIKTGELPQFQIDHFGTQRLAEKELRVLWVDERMAGHQLTPDQTLFQLQLRALEDINQLQSILQINQHVLVPEFISAEGALVPVRLRMSVVDAEAESEAAVTAPPQRGFEVSVFPNPTRELLHFQFAAARGGQAQIRIYNTFGQLVRTVQQPCAVGDNTLRIEGLSQTGGGTFFYTLAGPGFQQKGRFSVLPR